MKRPALLISALAFVAAPASALAEGPQGPQGREPIPTVVVIVPEAPPPPPSRVDVNLGFAARAMILPSAGFDPFSTNDLLVAPALTAGLTVLRAGPVSFTVSGEWSAGNRSAIARGEEASLTLHRLAAVAEARFHVGRRVFLGLKLAPAAYHLRATLADASVERPLVSRTWTWGLDATGGLGLLLGSTGPQGARFWMTFDAGYAFAGKSELRFSPAPDAEDPRKYGAVALPAFEPAGPVSRLGLTVAF